MIPHSFGVGVTESYDNPAEAALLVMVDLTKTPESMPALVGGIRLRYVRLNRLHVTRANHPVLRGRAAANSTRCGTRSSAPPMLRPSYALCVATISRSWGGEPMPSFWEKHHEDRAGRPSGLRGCFMRPAANAHASVVFVNDLLAHHRPRPVPVASW